MKIIDQLTAQGMQNIMWNIGPRVLRWHHAQRTASVPVRRDASPPIRVVTARQIGNGGESVAKRATSKASDPFGFRVPDFAAEAEEGEWFEQNRGVIESLAAKAWAHGSGAKRGTHHSDIRPNA